MKNNDPFTDLIRSIEENLQGGGEWVPPDSSGGEVRRGNPRRILWFLIPLLIFLFFNQVIGFLTDWSWYDSVGLTSVFRTRILARFVLFAVGALLFWVILAANVLLARRLEPNGLRGTPVEQIVGMFGLRVVPTVLVAGAVVAFFMGIAAAAIWEEVLLYLNQASFNIVDPVFGRDIGFFVFALPIWQAVRTWLLIALAITLIAVVFTSGIGWREWSARTPVLLHFGALGALILLLIAWQYQIDAYQLVYSTRGAVFGAGYADEKAQLPAYNILTVVTMAAALLLIVMVFLRRAWRAMVVVLVVWFVVAILAGNVYPAFVQRFQVSPNELNLERPYIENNIEFTRVAFDLDSIEVADYDASNQLTVQAVLSEAETLSNVRLWDYRPLLQTYNQVQALRQYYAFNDIDIDRYFIDEGPHQVMLSARELVADRLTEDAQTWVNQRLVYTHGYGVAASPVSHVTRDGLPEFYLKDLPTQGVITITQPQLYFGELTDNYVIVRTAEPEFDYPSGNGNVTTSFTGETGIGMNWWARLLFALRYADINMLLNQDINSESRLLWRRNIRERIEEVAPFLHYDQDPYIVIGEDGKLYWFLDAYTVSDRFPYSEPLGTINYIRNSVKVVTDAYDGTMTFYVVDDSEPIIAAYSRIFPALFRPIEEMPDDLKRHVRYPSDLFSVQAEVFRTYHMTNVTEFYNREDLWAWPEEVFESSAQRMLPYYVLMQLPGEEGLEFVQILPFTPANRENMIAWMAAQSDLANYGRKLVFEFGKDALVFGPKQIEGRIDQNPEISAQLSLWNQQGSNVIRGNLLVIPVAGSLVYVEPLYLQAATGKIPELKRVIVATADRVEMADNLGLAFVKLFGRELLADAGLADLATFGGQDPGILTSAEIDALSSADGGVLEDDTLGELVDRANDQYSQAQEAARAGDWARFGSEMEALQVTLEQLSSLLGIEDIPEEVEPGVEPPLEEETAPEAGS